MSTYTYSNKWSESQILEAAKELKGKVLKDIDKKGWLANGGNKGRIGNMIQEDFFGIPANSDRAADFKYHGIELKVTPVKRNQKEGFSSKERLVLGMINYMKDYEISFEESVPNKKTKSTLLIFYLHEENQPVETFKILESVLFKLPVEDLPQVKEDYQSIINMIVEGRAHELSEKQQKFLGACTKGQGNGKDWVIQPFSSEQAKSRAYSYKVGYMSAYFRKLIAPEEVENILIPNGKSFIETVESTLNKYVGLDVEDIREMVGYMGSEKDKSYLAKMTHRMFGDNMKSNINNTEEFLKYGYAVKIVTNRFINHKNQDMSFQNLDFTEIQYDSFEDSTWYGLFAETKYILAVWDEYDQDKYKFSHYVYWIPDDFFISQAKKMYEYVQEMLLKDEIEIYNEGKTRQETWPDNLPKKGFIEPFQIRPKGTKQSSIISLPNGKLIKKKTFFIDKKYIRKIVGLEK